MRAPGILDLALFWFICPLAAPVRICAFNAQRFGETKMAKITIRNTIVQILTRCDICLLQEVQDARGRAIPALMKELNRVHGSEVFAHISSAALGRKSYQEKYVFVYRSDRAEVTDSYQYEDNHPEKPDVFAREPFIVRFHLPTTAVKDLVLVPQHTSPQDAVKEIDALYDVFQAVKERWKPKGIMLLGDFNADCDYVAKKRWPQIRLRVEPSLTWLIGDEVDTTVRANTNCAYDRIVIYGEKLAREIVLGSARAYDFPQSLGLSEAEALEVSDHYPVEVQLNSVQLGKNGQNHLLVPTTLILLLTASLGLGLLTQSFL
ncbi:deoxyribonuclease-1-like 1 [Ambystoma mexicanum]|uniref:deoxyribonuclease-1-like 1 n=1 Tax=Ambystoma mexicanum TaxID=8296 RepID=UPI0037E84204